MNYFIYFTSMLLLFTFLNHIKDFNREKLFAIPPVTYHQQNNMMKEPCRDLRTQMSILCIRRPDLALHA